MLQDEIDKKSSEIYKEVYQMSIGELANLYKDQEVDVHPEFQRLYRWSEYQKTKLIESIMLNIPIPPIYVSQDEKGIREYYILRTGRRSCRNQFVISISPEQKTIILDELEYSKA